MAKMDRKVGRPPAYTSVAEMERLIDKYFEDCKGELALDNDGLPMLYKGMPVYSVPPKPLTVTGLALALGFNSRQSLLNYQGKPQFMDTITRAKAKVEEYAESRLFDKDGANGAKFSLANNFKGWKNKQNLEHSGGLGVKIVDDIDEED